MDPDLGSWADVEHLCPSEPGNSLCSPESGVRVCSLLGEPRAGGHASPSPPAASGSASPQPPASWGLTPLPHVLSPGAPRGRQGAGGGAGGGAGLPGQPLQVHEGATHAHREGAPSRLQAECVPGVQARGGAGRGPPSGATPTCHRGCAQKGCPLQALAWQWVRPDVHPYRPHRVRSAQPSWCPCLGMCWFCASLTGPWGQGAACPLLPPRLTGAPPPLIPS